MVGYGYGYWTIMVGYGYGYITIITIIMVMVITIITILIMVKMVIDSRMMANGELDCIRLSIRLIWALTAKNDEKLFDK